MGKKDTNKKGKQREAATANPAGAAASAPAPPQPPPPPPPPVPVPSPPAAQHIPPITIDTIEEEAEYQGLPAEGPLEGEDEWENVGQSGAIAADGWPSNEAGNSHGDWGVDDGFGAATASSVPMPHPPPSQQRGASGGKIQSKQHHQLQLRHQLPQSTHGDGWNAPAGAWNGPGMNATWSNSPIQNTDNAWGNLNDGDEGSEDQYSEDDVGDGWDGNAGAGWSQQPVQPAPWPPPPSGHSTHSQAPSHQQASTWRGWSEEARRLPKVTFDSGPSFPPSTGNRAVLSQAQHTQILNTLLNKPQQSQQQPDLPNRGTPLHPPTAPKGWPQQPTAAVVPPHLDSKRHQYKPQHIQHHPSHWPFPQPQHPQHQPEQYGPQEVRKNKKNRPEYYQQDKTSTSKKPQQEQEVGGTWGVDDDWHDVRDEEEDYDATHDAWGRKVHFTPVRTTPPEPPSVNSAVVENFTVNALPSNKLGLSAYPISRTLSYAYSGTAASFGSGGGGNTMPQIASVHFLESQGEALKCVRRAFYNKSRKAEDRFHWLFPPEKDERVRSLLHWIQSVSFSIASFGLQKFLQTRERGALIVNADYRPLGPTNEPVVDWITWDQIQPTMDRILQESVGYYNPAIHIIIFVFLPSPSGNSLAIWRRKIPIPNSIRLAYQAQITQAIASLRRDYPVLIDQLPLPSPPPPPEPPRKKRKWYKLWLST